jgi:hypothetical protein
MKKRKVSGILPELFKKILGRNFEPRQKLRVWAEILCLGRNFHPR